MSGVSGTATQAQLRLLCRFQAHKVQEVSIRLSCRSVGDAGYQENDRALIGGMAEHSPTGTHVAPARLGSFKLDIDKDVLSSSDDEGGLEDAQVDNAGVGRAYRGLQSFKATLGTYPNTQIAF